MNKKITLVNGFTAEIVQNCSFIKSKGIEKTVEMIIVQVEDPISPNNIGVFSVKVERNSFGDVLRIFDILFTNTEILFIQDTMHEMQKIMREADYMECDSIEEHLQVTEQKLFEIFEYAYNAYIHLLEI